MCFSGVTFGENGSHSFYKIEITLEEHFTDLSGNCVFVSFLFNSQMPQISGLFSLRSGWRGKHLHYVHKTNTRFKALLCSNRNVVKSHIHLQWFILHHLPLHLLTSFSAKAFCLQGDESRDTDGNSWRHSVVGLLLNMWLRIIKFVSVPCLVFTKPDRCLSH